MGIIVPKFTDDRTLAQIHAQLMSDIVSCESMIDYEFDEDDTDQRIDFKGELEEMCQQLGNLEEVMALKLSVDCDCFYTDKDHE